MNSIPTYMVGIHIQKISTFLKKSKKNNNYIANLLSERNNIISTTDLKTLKLCMCLQSPYST